MYCLFIYLLICFLTYLFTYLFIHSCFVSEYSCFQYYLFLHRCSLLFLLSVEEILKRYSYSRVVLLPYQPLLHTSRNWLHAIIFYLVFLAIYFLKFRNGCSLLIFHIVLLATLDLNCLKSFYIKKVSYTIPQNVDLVKDIHENTLFVLQNFFQWLFYSS